ncbi:transcriptional regulator with XRE-family HTH domain [Streptomyces violarus]|uniref:Transcriptional regulator with XRE-family HTH domain n=1 Tax=Streptomyces violarus TaxID=67380 RepID=A0A7W5F532_9ACTN|nr:transcriptional regulator with XRE-family HTH domain [Streptomyces violarus]
MDNNDLLNHLLEGEPPPAWTKRPNAKDDLREKARELRLQGWTYDQIQVELGCSKSSISLWVRDLPKPERKRTPEEASAIARRGWKVTLQRREEERQHTKAVAQQAVGDLTDREVFLAGVALYWAEGAKDKSYSRRERLHFINSDPNVISFFLRWLDVLGVERERLRFRVSIHESANVQEAEEFWAGLAGVAPATLQKATLKKHNPKTSRKNTSEAYRGCLIVYVLKSANLYRRMEGAWYGIVGGAARRPD